MKVVNALPPNYEEIKKHFDIVGRDIVFTYGETVYNPSEVIMPLHLMIHENTHVMQQREMSPEKWWEKYFTDPGFRLEQEVEAYQAQYQFVLSKEYNREKRAMFLHNIATDLSSPIYGSIIGYEDARRLIRL